MPTNFGFLNSDSQFVTFAEMAIKAELVLPISPALSATGCCAALELAIKWMYSVDKSLTIPSEKNLVKLVTLMSNEEFHKLLPEGLLPKLQ